MFKHIYIMGIFLIYGFHTGAFGSWFCRVVIVEITNMKCNRHRAISRPKCCFAVLRRFSYLMAIFLYICPTSMSASNSCRNKYLTSIWIRVLICWVKYHCCKIVTLILCNKWRKKLDRYFFLLCLTTSSGKLPGAQLMFLKQLHHYSFSFVKVS